MSRQAQPIEPFEFWVERPNLPSGRKLFRPLHYCLAHRFLPAAHFKKQGVAEAAFESSLSKSALMDQLWRWAADQCMDIEVWSRFEVLAASGFKDYLSVMATTSSRHLLSLPQHDVCLLVMPPAIAVAEAVYVALCRRKHSAHESTYFALERSHQPDTTFFTEWKSNGVHENLGPCAQISKDEFARAVIARLG